MYFHNSLVPRGAYFLLPLKSKQEATWGWNFTKCISEVKANQLKVKNMHVTMGITTFKQIYFCIWFHIIEIAQSRTWGIFIRHIPFWFYEAQGHTSLNRNEIYYIPYQKCLTYGTRQSLHEEFLYRIGHIPLWFNEAFGGHTSLNHNEIWRIPYENASRTRLRNLCINSTLYFNWMNNLQNYWSILWELKKMQKDIKKREKTVVYW